MTNFHVLLHYASIQLQSTI